MKRLIIICEGPTEVEFCKDVLYTHFFNKGITIQTPLIKKSGGGIVSWDVLKTQIEKHLLETGVIVTTLIDYYGIPDKYNYPNWQKAREMVNPSDRMDLLEQGMMDDISEDVRFRFLPYIQLHEFEGLLFNDMAVFDRHIAPNEFENRQELEDTISDNPNPELINNNPTSAPSKRLMRLIKGYNKIVYGSILAESLGLKKIRDKSPRFNQWMEKLEQI